MTHSSFHVDLDALPAAKPSVSVVGNDGTVSAFSSKRLTAFLSSLTSGLDTSQIKIADIVSKVEAGLYEGVTSKDLVQLTAEVCAYLSTWHPDSSFLAARVSLQALYETTKASFSETARILYDYINPRNSQKAPLISDDLYKLIQEHAEAIDAEIDHSRDNGYDYFGFRTLERSYLLRTDGQVCERPQHMLMRVSLGIHFHDLKAAFETYKCMSQRLFTHASPTLFNAGTPCPQLSSCFLLAMKEDSIEGIYETLKECALISKSAGGIGISISNIRCTGSYIRGSNGTSNGIVPLLRVFNDTARYVDQGGGKRKGAFAAYLEPWHGDIMDFLELRKNTGKEERRTRDLFLGLWVPDLFMKRVEANQDWSLFCPNEAPGLVDVYGEEFEALYEKYEREGRALKRIPAQQLWFAIIDAQMETGTPYMLYKDHCNRKSNQKNLGTIRCSNLCTEIIEYTAPDEIAVCNLASIALPRFITSASPAQFDFNLLYETTKIVTRNLNKIIDCNRYPVPEARNSNLKHRPMGIGVQGLADAFILLRLPFDSDGAKKLNKDIFETIYFAAVEASMEAARIDGPYASFEGSPMSKGIFQFDMWNVKPDSGRWDWERLRAQVLTHGVRNSLLVAPMPTASTSQILGNNEAIEAYTSNLYTRRVLAGEFPVVNTHLVRDLIRLGLWTPDVRRQILASNGSVLNIQEIPSELRQLYRTVWELKQRSLVDMAADRGPFIDQSQSFNVFFAEPSAAKLTSLHFHCWKRGLKTGMYYLRTRPAADAIKFTVESTAPVGLPLSMGSPSLHLPQPLPVSIVTEGSEGAEGKVTAVLRTSESESAEDAVNMFCTREEGCLMCGS